MRHGIIGLGLLGTAIAERLHAAGIELEGWDVDSGNLQRSVAAGHVRESDARSIAASCERVVLCLPTTAVVESVVEDLRGALRNGTILIDTTTGSPAQVEQIAQRLAPQGVDYLDACVGGSSEDVRQNRAMILCGGSAAAFGAAKPVLDAIASSTYHLGAAGCGTRMKLVFNLVLGMNRAVLAEGLSFAEKAGIQPEDALRVLQHGAAYSRVMDTKGRKMVEQNFEPQARLAQHWKDVRQILEEGAGRGARLPLSELHEKMLRAVDAAGYGADDNSAIIRWYRQQS